MAATHSVIIKGLFLLPSASMLELQILIPQSDCFGDTVLRKVT